MRFLIDSPEVSRGPCLSAPLLAAPARGAIPRPIRVIATGMRPLLRNAQESIYEDSIDAKALSPAYTGL